MARSPVVIVVLAVAAVTAVTAVTACGKAAPFDREQWLHADDRPAVRKEMAKSLVRGRQLKGLDRAAVVALLGPPIATDQWPGTDMAYVLSPDWVDNYWLLIKLDASGKVSGAKVRVD
jgi:hypothetical protein